MNGNIQMKFLNHKKAFQSKVNRPLSNRLGGGSLYGEHVRGGWGQGVAV